MQLPSERIEPDDFLDPEEPSATPDVSEEPAPEMQGPLPEPEPVRTAAEILGLGFWAYSPDTSRLIVSDRAVKLLATNPPSEPLTGFDGLIVQSTELEPHLRGNQRFEIIVESASGRSVVVVGWPESGHEGRMVGVLSEVPRQVVEAEPTHDDSLLVEAVENGVEAMLVLRAVRDSDGDTVDFEVNEVNSRGAQMLARSREDSVGQLLTQLVPETRVNGVLEEYASVMDNHKPVEREYHASPGGFQQIWIRQRIVPLTDGVAVFSTDVTAARRQGESVDRSRRMLEKIASTTPDILLLWDAQSRRFVFNNRSLQSLIGGSTVKTISGLAMQMVTEDRPKLEIYLESVLAASDDRTVEETFRVIGPSGSLRYFLFRSSPFERAEEGRLQTCLTTAQDVTQQVTYSVDLEAKMKELGEARGQLEVRQQELEELNLRLADLASTDALTGIKNRRAFEEKLDEEVERAQRYNSRLALVLADVDRFKIYNDTYGHPAGDQALKAFAQALTEVCRKSDTIARYGGEEFAVILPNTGAEEAAKLGERIRAALANTLIGRQGVTASIGCSEFTAGKEGRERLVGEADKALYKSKNEGKDRVTVFREE